MTNLWQRKACTTGPPNAYHLDRLIARYGIDPKLIDWSDEITGDCNRAISQAELSKP